jgi:hypothetical protein
LRANSDAVVLIAYRIWSANRETKLLNVGTLVPVAVVMLESGLLYTIVTAIQLAMFLKGSAAYKIAQDAVSFPYVLLFELSLEPEGHANHCTYRATKNSELSADFL